MPSIGGNQGQRHRGVYNAATAYVTNDVVTYSGAAYTALTVTTGNAPTNTNFWGLLVSTVPGVPSGGTAQQQLAKASGSDFDLTWQAASAGGASAAVDPLYVVPAPLATGGVWYSNRYMYGIVNTQTQMTAANTYYQGIILGQSASITGIAAYAGTSTAAGTVNLAIALPASTGWPGTIIASGSASVSAGVAGPCIATISAVTVPASMFYVCIGTAATGMYLHQPNLTGFSLRPLAGSSAINSTTTASFRYTGGGTPISNPAGLVGGTGYAAYVRVA